MEDLDNPFTIRSYMPFSASGFLPGSDSQFIALPLFGPPRIYTVDLKLRTQSYTELFFEDEDYTELSLQLDHFFRIYCELMRINLYLSLYSRSESQYCCLEFTKKGDLLYLGNAKGSIFVVDVKDHNLLYSLNLGSSRASVKQIHVHSSGR